MFESKKAYIGLGSNIGDRQGYIKAAIALLSANCEIIKISSLYETEPVGFTEQSWFYNCVIQVKTTLSSQQLIEFMQEIEQKLLRIRKFKNGPRTIDLDLLFYNQEVISEPTLKVPHPRICERLFVIEPLAEIAGDFVHTTDGRKISTIREKLVNKSKDYGIRKVDSDVKVLTTKNLNLASLKEINKLLITANY